MDPSLYARTGQTRTHLGSNHALIAPDGHVPSPMVAWNNAVGVVLISPAMGAGLVQSLVTLDEGTTQLKPSGGVEICFYVLQGELSASFGVQQVELRAGSYFYWPSSEVALEISVRGSARIVAFEKRYEARPGAVLPEPVWGHEGDVEAKPFLGDPDARLQVLLPEDAAYDMAVNLFTYQPGATLPFVETHVMEHGLMMLDGMGIYRLDECWYPVAAGDSIWMAPYCPQWFAATGKTPARYIYYKNVNRDAGELL